MSPPQQADDPSAAYALGRLREATRNSPYEGRIYLVGGLLRDRALGLPLVNDLDLVVEGDALELARFLFERGLSPHFPVLYPRFGTAMIHISDGVHSSQVELVSARAESYQPDSRKPDVVLGTLRDDVFRRDFTINTLLENLHTGEAQDVTGRAWDDLRAGVVRTPLEPRLTFYDDPLRMLRAVRFAARFDFRIEQATWDSLCAERERLRPPTIAFERIREEFIKIVKLPGAKFRNGMELLLETGLLAQFLPEMLPMVGCTQNAWHLYDVWTHTLVALENLPDSARLEARLGLLWHDVGKPATRTEDARGVHFYGHPNVGSEIAREMMHRLKFSNDEIRDVTQLVLLHQRLGEYKANWADAPVKRLIRACAGHLDDLFVITACDIAGADIPPEDVVDLVGLRKRIDALNAVSNVTKIESPLDGNEIMDALAIDPGPALRDAKDFLVNEVIDGRLPEGDKQAATEALKRWWADRTGSP